MATSLKLSETVIDAVLKKLRNGLDARLATINAENNDDIVLTSPADDAFHAFGLSGYVGFPAILVTEMPAADEYEAQSASAFVWVGSIAVFVYEEDVDRDRLGRKLLRQCRAVTEVLWDDPPRMSLDGSAFLIRPNGHRPGPVFEAEDESSMYRAWRAQIFRARQNEGP